MTPEQKDKKRFEGLLKKCKAGYMFQTIETGAEDGIPDVYLRTLFHDNWLEFKHLRWPARDTTQIKPGLRPDQFSWINRTRNLQARVFLVTMTTDYQIIIHYNYEIRMHYANRFHFLRTSIYHATSQTPDPVILYALFNSEPEELEKWQQQDQHRRRPL